MRPFKQRATIAICSALMFGWLVTNASAQKAVPLESATLHGDELIQTPIGEIELVDTFFDDDASTRLFDEMDYQRAAQCYIWSTPRPGATVKERLTVSKRTPTSWSSNP